VYEWLFGYNLPDTVLLLRKDGTVYFLGTKKKVEFLQPVVQALASGKYKSNKMKLSEFRTLLRNKSDNNASNYDTLWEAAGIVDLNGTKRKVGIFVKERTFNVNGGGIVGPWEEKLSPVAKTNGDSETGGSTMVELVDVSHGVAFCMSVKDETELDLMKKSSVLSNKVMKHGWIKKMEQVIDGEESITHDKLATYIDEILEDPSKISLKVPREDVASCYFPIVQSGGEYDLRVTAQTSSTTNLSHDVITVSLGARYKGYCSNIARTFLVDPPKHVSELYEVLCDLQDECISALKPGNQFSMVHKTAVDFLKTYKRSGSPAGSYAYLVDHLPKSLGFLTGIDFRENHLQLSAKNSATIKAGMVFCLSIGFANLPLSEKDRADTPDKSPVRPENQCFHLFGWLPAVLSHAFVPFS